MYKSALLSTLRLPNLLNYAFRQHGISSQHLLKCTGVKQIEQQKKNKTLNTTAPLINSSHRPVSIHKTGKSNKVASYIEKSAEARVFHLEGEMSTILLDHHPGQ